MEKIVFDVDERVAKAWREASSDKRRDITNKVSIRLNKELFDYDKDSFIAYIKQLQLKMEERGLTQEILDDILNDEA